MKICFIQYNLGAKSETFLTRHINSLKNDFDVYCITGKVHDKNILHKSKVYVYTKLGYFVSFYKRLLNRFNKNYFLHSKSIFKGIELIKPDLVVFQFGFLPVLCIQHVIKLNIPFIIIHHGTDLNKARLDDSYRRKLKLIWEKAASVIFISLFLYEEAIKLGLDRQKSEVVYLGVPIYRDTKDKIKSKNFHIVSIGRLEKVKNHEFLIKAFKLFNDKYPNTKLTIIGDGKEKEDLIQLVTDLELVKNVELTGALAFNEVEVYLNQAHVSCLVSKKVVSDYNFQEEGLGLTLLEASLRKIPLIGAKSGGIPEVIIHNDNGLLIEPDNVQQLFEAMEFIYLNEDKAAAMGKRAHELVLEKFDQNLQIEKFKAIYLKSI